LADGRERRINVRLDAVEYADVLAAAHRSGLTPSGFTAEATLAAARQADQQAGRVHVETVRELMAARAQLRRYGSNLNQAARALNAGGDAPEWLKSAIGLTDRVVHRIDQAVQDLLDPPRGRA
jgi:uncharacterized protein (DUF1778 family)